MKKIIRVYSLEQKMAIRCALKSFITSVILMGLLGTLLLAYLKAVKTDNSNAILRIGVVNEGADNSFSAYLTFASKLSSLSDFCRLDSFDKEEAFEALSEGRIQMIMVVPEYFIEDAVHMRDASFTVYLPGKEPGIRERKVMDLLVAVEDIMLTTEGSILSMYKGMELYTYPVTVSEMENNLTNLYVYEFLNRDDYFDVTYSSGFGEFTVAEYYLGAAFIMCVLISGVFFLRMYDGQIRFVEKMFATGLGERILLIVLKILSIAISVCAPAWLLLYVADMICKGLGSSFIYARAGAYLMVAVISLSVAAFINLMGTIFADSVDKNVSYLLLVLFFGVISGVVGTRYYLPGFIREIADFWPFACYHKKLMISVWNYAGIKDYLEVTGYSLLLIVAGILLFIKSDWKKSRYNENNIY